MTPETLEALKGSIEKWRRIVEEGGADEGIDNCPLCEMFYDKDDDDRECCAGCPVSEFSKLENCHGTPYWGWGHLFIHADQDRPWRPDTDEKMIAARAELEFLRSLLPQEEAS